MNINEIGRLLGRIAITDGRKVDPTTILDWEQILPEWIDLDLAMRAVIEHRRATPDWIEPAHVIAWAKTLQGSDHSIDDRRDVHELLHIPPDAITLRRYLELHPEERAIVEAFRHRPGVTHDQAPRTRRPATPMDPAKRAEIQAELDAIRRPEPKPGEEPS